MIRISSRGSFNNTNTFLNRMKSRSYLAQLAKYGPVGVAALRAATSIDSGRTSEAWYYQVVNRPGYFAIHWLNSHIEQPGSIPIAAILQYGHGTRSGGYIQGRDYINPAMRPIFDQILTDMWKEVTK